MAKVYLFGYYGFGNLGDELMARYFLSQIREAFPETGLVLLTGDPRSLPEFGEERISRWNLPHLAKLLQPGDLLVGGGGSIFQDATSKRSLLYYLSLLSLADRRKARVMLFGQGFGPLSAPGAWATGRALRKVRALSCRDPLSAGLLEKMGVTCDRFRVGVDPLWDLPGAGPAGLHKYKEEKKQGPRPARKKKPAAPPVIGVFLRRGREKYKYALLKAVEKEFPGSVRLFALAPGDAFGLQGPAAAGRHRYRPAVFLENQEQLEKACSGLSLVIGERLHGLLFAARLGVPGIGLGDDPKITVFCRELGWPAFSWQEPDLGEKIRKALADLWPSYSHIRQETLAVRERMMATAREDRLWFLERIREELC
ncbi:MAG: hypothetical protein GX036_03345 [Firmicutes bacterium]|jgi:polysaccharide pyruvyl transferase CsaB|nr:hypothetical protein [Bacillota bacterium]